MVQWDAAFVVTRWAGEAEAMFRWSAVETVGQPIMDLGLIHPEDIPVESTMAKLNEGKNPGVVGSNRNVTSPHNVCNQLYFAGGFRSELEDVFVDSMLTTALGDDNYPGDSVPSENWPGFAPGSHGVLNTLTPGHHDVNASWTSRSSHRYCGCTARRTPSSPTSRSSTWRHWGSSAPCPAGQVRRPARHSRWSAKPAPCWTLTRRPAARAELELGCGHTPHVEKAAGFNEALAAHVRGAGGR